MSNKVYNARLSHDLFEVIENGEAVGYGGSQSWYPKDSDKKCACGITAAADVILYINALRKQNFRIEKEDFINVSGMLKKKYLPVIPRFGVNSFILAIGMCRYFRKMEPGYVCYWKITPFRKWKTVEKMLKNDIPVILAIGSNFPIVWGKHGLKLYRKTDTGVSQTDVKGHYVVITGIHGDTIVISSWGKKYYIKKSEFDAYVRRYSGHLYSNILVIMRTKDRNSKTER